MAWKRELTLAALNASSENTMVAHLGIIYTRLEAGLLHLSSGHRGAGLRSRYFPGLRCAWPGYGSVGRVRR